MRFNGFISCILVGIGSIFLFCSRSDVISGVAERVVSDMDNTLTDTLNRFVRIDLDSVDVDSAYSLPAAADPAFSTAFTDSGIIVGVNGEGDTLTAHIQYAVAPGSTQYDTSDSHSGAYLYFSAADAPDGSESIAVYLSKAFAAADFRYVDRSDKEIIHTDTIITPKEPECEGCEEPEPDYEYKHLYNEIGRFAPENGIDSVLLPQEVADSIFSVRASAGADTAAFAFSIVDYAGNALKISRPYLILNVVKKDGGEKVRDSIPASFTRVTAFENVDGISNRRGELPYSSRSTKRTAVFKISLDKIIRDLKGRRGEYVNMNAVITVKPGRNPGESDSAAGDYRIFVSDTLFSDAASLNERFGGKSSSFVKPVLPYNTFSIGAAQPVNPSIQSVLDRKREYLYVYLRADSEDGAIIWDKESIGIETVFTPSR